MKKQILLVDDDVDLVRAMEAVLSAKGYDVVTAKNGTEGLAQVAKKKPDLMVLDVMMDSDTEGFTVAYKLQENEATRKIPIILLSGFTDHIAEKYDAFESIQGRDWPAAKFLKKPVTMNELLAAVAAMLAEKA